MPRKEREEMKKIDFWPFGEHRRVTSVVGEREFMYKGDLVKDFHKGWDIGLPSRSMVESPEDGIVKGGFDKAFGNWGVLLGSVYRWNFWHLYQPPIWNDKNLRGMIISSTGNSGMSTAPHCHMQIAPADSKPGEYIDPFEVFTDEILETLEFPNNPGELERVKGRKFYEGKEWEKSSTVSKHPVAREIHKAINHLYEAEKLLIVDEVIGKGNTS
jgi:murein DD-endopeptidase MepM/ murein hydrolase activator NlpD